MFFTGYLKNSSLRSFCLSFVNSKNSLGIFKLTKGDFKNYSNLLYFANLLKENVCVFIDEAHLFLSAGEKAYQLNHLYYTDRGKNSVITSNSVFSKKSFAEKALVSLNVSKPNLN